MGRLCCTRALQTDLQEAQLDSASGAHCSAAQSMALPGIYRPLRKHTGTKKRREKGPSQYSQRGSHQTNKTQTNKQQTNSKGDQINQKGEEKVSKGCSTSDKFLVTPDEINVAMVKRWVTVQSYNLGIQATEEAKTTHAQTRNLPSRGSKEGGAAKFNPCKTTSQQRKRGEEPGGSRGQRERGHTRTRRGTNERVLAESKKGTRIIQ